MKHVALWLFCLVFALPTPGRAEFPPEFKKVYEAYTDLIKQDKVREAIPYARKALDIALQSDAFSDEARGRLAFNLGYVYLRDYQFTASSDAFTQALELFEKAGGNADLKAEALMYRGICHRNLYKYNEARRDLDQALTLLTGEEPIVRVVRAQVLENLAWVEIAERRPFRARNYAEEAHEIYASIFSESHPKTVNSLVVLSAANYLRGSRGRAFDLLAQATDLAEKAGLPKEGEEAKPGQFTLHGLASFHFDVASLYELMGRKQDARYHRDVAKDLRKGIPPAVMRVVPVKREPPSYPSRAARRGVMGWAIVEHTVRKDGTTADIRIIDSAPEGYFESATKEAVKEWKYEPPTEDGQPAEVKGVRTTVKFMLER